METHIPNLVTSGLSKPFTEDGVTGDVQIYRLEHEPLWTLEVVNDAGTSIVWDDEFRSDTYQEVLRTVTEEGMEVFLDTGKVIPFRR